MKIVAILLLLASTASFALQPLTPTMVKKDSSYSLTVNFKTSLPREKLMEVLLTYEHTKQYVKQPNLSIKLISEKPSWNILEYRYNYFVAKMDMGIENWVSPDHRTFTFKQISYHRTNGLIPNLISSGGKYEILSESNGVSTVRYTQYGKMGQKISGIFQGMIQSESMSFIKSLVKYLNKLETAKG